METTSRAYGTGRRKSSVARVWLRPGEGKVQVNERPVDEFFTHPTLKMLLMQPLKIVGQEGKYDVMASVSGGGSTGQAGAIRLGIARALVQGRRESPRRMGAGARLGSDPMACQRFSPPSGTERRFTRKSGLADPRGWPCGACQCPGNGNSWDYPPNSGPARGQDRP